MFYQMYKHYEEDTTQENTFNRLDLLVAFLTLKTVSEA